MFSFFAQYSETKQFFAKIKGLYLQEIPNVEKQYFLVYDAGNYHQYLPALSLLKSYRVKIKTINSLATAIAAIHKLGMAHKNLIPTRIFFSEDLSLRLVGFESPRNIFMQSSTKCIRSRYSGPEVVHTRAASQVSDLFAAGVMFWEIWYGMATITYTPQFADTHIDDTLKTIIATLMNSHETKRGTMQQFVEQMLPLLKLYNC